MAVTKKNVNGIFYFTYPSSDVFLKERNYFVFEDIKQVYLTGIKIGSKTIDFGGEFFLSKPFYLDVSAYYAKYNGKFSVTIYFNSEVALGESTTITINATTHDCYDPFKEFVPDSCGDAPYARIVPPNRMLWDGKKETSSLLSAMRDSDYFSGYEYEMDGVPYANYRPSDAWLTTTQKNEHLGETYLNTLKSNGNLAELDGNGNPLWIEQGSLVQTVGASFGEQRVASNLCCRTKTIFNNYNGLTIGEMPDGYRYFVFYYDKNKKYKGREYARTGGITLNNAADNPYISLVLERVGGATDLTPSDLVGITSSALTNPDAGKSYRWVEQNGVFSWLELAAEQIVNNSFAWYFGGQRYFDDVINKTATFGKSFEALYQRVYALSPTTKQYTTIQNVSRSVSLSDSSMPYVYIRWKTPWGVTVEHLFYLGSYTSDKADAKELESVNYYEELSKHVRVGSFYLDGITQPYDLFYYKTLENAELVEMYFPYYAFNTSTYMPNGDTYVAVKIKGSNIKDAVVDGVTQSTITFDFEMR